MFSRSAQKRSVSAQTGYGIHQPYNAAMTETWKSPMSRQPAVFAILAQLYFCEVRANPNGTARLAKWRNRMLTNRKVVTLFQALYNTVSWNSDNGNAGNNQVGNARVH